MKILKSIRAEDSVSDLRARYKGFFLSQVQKATTRRFCLHSLQEEEKRKLAHEIYFSVHQHVFDGTTFQDFSRYVFESSAESTTLHVLYSAAGAPVGYFAFHVYRTEYTSTEGKIHRPYVFRAETGILPEHRQSSRTTMHVAQILTLEVMRLLICKGFPEAWFVATFIHPVPYMLMERDLYEVYPRPEQRIPTQIESLMKRISASLCLKDAHPTNNDELCLVKKVGWKVIDPVDRVKQTRSSTNKSVQFYCDTNPMYQSHGTGLLFVAPANLRNVVFSLCKYARRMNALRQK